MREVSGDVRKEKSGWGKRKERGSDAMVMSAEEREGEEREHAEAEQGGGSARGWDWERSGLVEGFGEDGW